MGAERHKPTKPRRRYRRYIFRPWITQPDGTRRYARDHGLKAWKIPVED